MILYKSNAAAAQADVPVVRTDYSPNAVTRYIEESTRKVGKNDIEIDASMLQQRIFPTPHRTIFISHLSAYRQTALDIKEAIEFWCPGYTCFIDSEVWGNMYTILRKLQNKYALLPNGHYRHEMVNNICQHLSLILSMALTKAIKDSPYFLFVPGGDDEMLNGDSISTTSPWVCHELLTASLLPERGIQKEAAVQFAAEPQMNLTFRYSADALHLHRTSLEEFIAMLRQPRR